MKPPLTLAERIERYSVLEPATGCLLWTRSVNKDGYGQIRNAGKTLKAHRVAWITLRGPIPPGKMVCHRCDVPRCINPDHLFLGSMQDNMDDMARKGRSRVYRGEMRGERNPFAKLTAAQVIAIRADRRTQDAIAAHYGISQSIVSDIKIRKCWGHLPESDEAAR